MKLIYASGEESQLGDIVRGSSNSGLGKAKPGDLAIVDDNSGRDIDQHPDCVNVSWRPPCEQADGGYYPSRFDLVCRKGDPRRFNIWNGIVKAGPAQNAALRSCPYRLPQPIPGFEPRQLRPSHMVYNHSRNCVPIYDQPRELQVAEQVEKFRLDVVRNLLEVPCCNHHNKLVNVEIVASTGQMRAQFRCPYCSK